MKIIFLISTYIVFFSVIASAQNESQGSIRIVQDPQIDTLLNVSKHLASNQIIEGFRVQIFMESGNDAVVRANAAIEQFKLSYPNLPAYLTFGQPYYRVRVGDFRTRLEAEGELKTIVSLFNQAFIIKDNILPPQLSSFPSNTIDYEQSNPSGN